ncbi:cation acetate symporter [Carbonactinospora thermoautotrophica]|uniref:solute symporter family protein n=1 Tax=Carbonactinospora thermoautotrophica TaxID=1469144 RepID=UPI00226FCD6F|nr:cation acetate symporter [Carbonactinospora thermoautotrophica]MCX9191396.1 cation acetate symporter [Carbonactinospora thermoautotrophica]
MTVAVGSAFHAASPTASHAAVSYTAQAGGHRALTISLFVAFVLVTLYITFWASRQTRTATDFYAAGRSFSGVQNGIAIAGDYMSAASFLGIAGLIALFGYDGFLYSIGFLVAWLVALLLVAELMRNSGRFTMADVLAFRMRQRPVRTAAGVSTIVVSIFYLLAQMVGAGSLVALLLGVKGAVAQNIVIVAVGALMIFYVTVGGMKGTTWVQIVKAVLLMAGTTLVTLLVLVKFDFNVSALLSTAAEQSGKGAAYLEPGLKYGATATSKLDFLSLALALVLGTAGLPHILIRFYTVPNAKAARKSVVWAIGIIGTFYLMTLALGFGAAALVGSKAIAASNKAGNTAAPLLAEAVGGGAGSTGGAVLLAVISAVAFATILAVVAGLTLASSSSFAHDLYANVIRKGQASEADEVRAARIAAFVIGAISIVLSIFAQKLNVAFLVALAFAVAASANLPTILYSLFWKRFNTTGAVWSIYGGLISSVVLVIFSPVVSGGKTPLISGADFHWFPLENPGIVSIPLGFLCGWLGTVLSKDRSSEEKYAELEVRALTGVGAH